MQTVDSDQTAQRKGMELVRGTGNMEIWKTLLGQ